MGKLIRFSVAVVGVALVAAALSDLTYDAPVAMGQDGGPRTIEVQVNSVSIDSFPRVRALVEVHQDGEAVLGLPLDSFSLFEDGFPRTLDDYCYFNETRPVDICFVVDFSFSMDPRIQRIRDVIVALVDSLPDQIDARFSLVRYGQSAFGQANTPPGFPRYGGSPIHESRDSLYVAERFSQRLDTLTQNTLSGGYEPAYQAILSAVRQTAWRTNSERYIVLVSDENNDTCRTVPGITTPQLCAEMVNTGITFMAWCNYDVRCDCYDNCPQQGRCDTLYDFGCLSGYDWFAPLASASCTGGETVPITDDFLDLWGFVRTKILSTYLLCYVSQVCCENGTEHLVQVNVTNDGEAGSGEAAFTLTECPDFAWSPATEGMINGPCQTAHTPMQICASFTRDGIAYSGLAVLYYRHDSQPLFYPVLMTHQGAGLWCAEVPTDSVVGPYVEFFTWFYRFGQPGPAIRFPCDTARICVTVPPTITCNAPSIFRCEDLTVVVDAGDIDGFIASAQFCYSIPQQSFDTCFALTGPAPWIVSIPYTRFGNDSVCVRATATDNSGLTANCGPHCSTPIPHPPVILHTPVTTRLACTSTAVCAVVTDARNDLSSIVVEWSCGDSLVTVPMLLQPVPPNFFCAALPLQFVNESCNVVYRIIATDNCFSQTISGPHTILTIPHCPVIVADTVTTASGCRDIQICAFITDAGGDLASASLEFRCAGSQESVSIPMLPTLIPFQYCATIPANRADPRCNLEYRVSASDFCSCTSATGWLSINVSTAPPIISHAPVTSRFDCHNVQICATVVDAAQGVASVGMFTACAGDTQFTPLVQQLIPPTLYCANLPASQVAVEPGCVVSYRIVASNFCFEQSSVGWYNIAVVPHCPVVVHDTVHTAFGCQPITFCALITDAGGDFAGATLQFRCAGDEEFGSIPFTPTIIPFQYCATIPGNRTNPQCDLQYRIVASDTCSCVTYVGWLDIDVITTPPTINHNPFTYRLECQNRLVCATVNDFGHGTGAVTLHAVCDAETLHVPMSGAVGIYCAPFPSQFITHQPGCTIRYSISAYNNCFQSAQTGWFTVVPVEHCPVITHAPIGAAYACQPITVCAAVSDSGGDLRLPSLTWKCAGDTANFTVLMTPSGPGIYCATIPALRPDQHCDLEYYIEATDTCGCVRATGWYLINITDSAPTVTCYTGNPGTVERGSNPILCAIAGDAVSTVERVTLSWSSAQCGIQTVECVYVPPVVPLPGRWCALMSAACMPCTGVVYYSFTAYNACDQNSSVTCSLNVHGSPPEIVCQVPDLIPHGQSYSACVFAGDPNGDLTPAVTARVVAGICDTTLPAVFVDVPIGPDPWCVDVPGSCTACFSGWAVVHFTATDTCGNATTKLCSTFVLGNALPNVACSPTNPVSEVHGTDIAVCAVASDSDGPLQSVRLHYQIGTCDSTVDAVFSVDRWCATIRGACSSCLNQRLHFTFTATDACGATASAACSLDVLSRPPVVSCGSIPASISPGMEFAACAVVDDADGDLSSVSLRYVLGACDESIAATFVDRPAGPDEWCATVPGGCSVCFSGWAYLYFTAVDLCGHETVHTCSTFVNPELPPTVVCYSGNPTTVPAGGSATVCAIANDADGVVESVQVHYWSTTCDGESPAVFVPAGDGEPDRWCATIPGSCSVSPGGWVRFQFTARDDCDQNTTSALCSLLVTMPEYSDLGDLPNPPYSTSPRLVGGPAHQLSGVCWLGEMINGEPIPFANVDGDLSDDGFFADCESEFWSECTDVTVAVTVSVGGGYTGQTLYLSGWIDMNGNGSLTDDITCPSGSAITEWVIPNRVVTPGANFLTFPVHSTGAYDGSYFVRLRLSTSPFAETDFADPVGSQRPDGEVEDYRLDCATDACCFMCEVPDAPLFVPTSLGNYEMFRLVVEFDSDRMLHLTWNDIPNAQYYDIYRGGVDETVEHMDYLGTVLAPATAWVESTAVQFLPSKNFYLVTAHGVIQQPAVPGSDCARWEMNEGSGEYTYDVTGNGHNAWRALPCPPDWGFENDSQCHDAPTGYIEFDGYVQVPERCEEHLEVANDPVFYQPRFQLWTRLRLTEEPTVDSGPFYIASNNSFDDENGGWALRIDPGWITLPDGTREYHNRLTGLVWDQGMDGGIGGWRTLISPPPSSANPSLYSVPLHQWSCICFVVNDRQSALLIDGRVVAAGRMSFNSHNNLAPLIIGGGYRHSTNPVEYPFRGDIDCMRITCIE